jgi:hypothetical protein
MEREMERELRGAALSEEPLPFSEETGKRKRLFLSEENFFSEEALPFKHRPSP